MTGSMTERVSQLKVLVMEDDLIASKMAEMVLKSKGCSVDCVFTGEAAINKLNEPYDLILLDLGLPDIHGFEVVKIIQNSKALLALAEMAIVTAVDSKENRTLAKQLGIRHYISKPFTMEKCELVLSDLLVPEK